MIIKNGILFCDDGIFRESEIKFSNGVISEIGGNISDNSGEILDARDCYIIPGLVDIHTHGAIDADFSDGTPEAIEKIAGFHLKNGVTSFLGTTMSLPEEDLLNICSVSKRFIGVQQKNRAVLQGIHLEGPFFNQNKKGAQNADYIINPNFEMFVRLLRASDNNIKLISVAPELEGGLDFINFASLSCKVSIGHSMADYETACSAFLGGATHTTHMFNGMNALLHREPGIIGAAFDFNAYAEVIADGVHIHPSVVRAVFKLFGDDKVCLISDSMRACGLENGRYNLGGQAVIVEGNASRTEDGSLAGSVTPLIDCMRNVAAFGIPLTSAIKAATVNPAKSVGIDKETGSVTVGKRADLLVIDKGLSLRHVILSGERFL